MGMPGLGELTKMLPEIKKSMAEMGAETAAMKALLQESVELQRRLVAIQEAQLSPAQAARADAILFDLRKTG